MDSKTVKALANAKINLHLEVLNRRADGYHNISTIFQSVSLADEVLVTVSDGSEITVTTENAVIDGENLAGKAAELFLAKIGKSAKVNIILKKGIPLSAGLAGGSADGAAVLCCLNHLLGAPLNEDNLLDLALKLGADVPFCVMGGTALAQGVGEKLSPTEYIGDYYIILIKHYKKSSTGEMYKRLDARTSIPTCSTDNILSALKNKNMAEIGKLSKNSFLEVSDNKAEQTKIINKLKSAGALAAGLSGSGPTVFGVFESVDKFFVDALKKSYSEAYLCRTADSGIKIIE